MTVGTLAATVTINGADVSSYVLSIKRDSRLCRTGQTCEIEMNANFPHGSYSPYNTLVITEQGTTVLTGYVSSIQPSRSPAKVLVTGKDSFKRCDDYFLPDQLLSNNETVSYWIDYLCTQAGVSYSILPSATGGSTSVGKDMPFGYRTVGDALYELCKFIGWQIMVNPSGVLEFARLGGQITVDIGMESAQGADINKTDADVRNVVKVFGFTPNGERLAVIKTRSVSGITNDRIGVWTDPNISTISFATDVANAGLDQYAAINKTGHIDTVGDATLRVGDVGYASLLGDSVKAYVTDISSVMDSTGYSMSVKLGRRCYPLPVFPSPNSTGGSTLALTAVATHQYIGRSKNFLSTPPVWANITGTTYTSGSTIQDLAIDPFDAVNKACVVTNKNIFTTTNLSGNTSWLSVQSAAQFQTATGKQLLRFNRVKYSSKTQNALFVQALGIVTSGSDTIAHVYIGSSSNGGSSWIWTNAANGTFLYTNPHFETGFEVSSNDVVLTGMSDGALVVSTNPLAASPTYANVCTNTLKDFTIAQISNIAMPTSDKVWISGRSKSAFFTTVGRYDSYNKWVAVGVSGEYPIQITTQSDMLPVHNPAFTTEYGVDMYEFTIPANSHIDIDFGAVQGASAVLYLRIAGNNPSSWGAQLYGSSDGVTYNLISALTFYQYPTPGTSGGYSMSGLRFIRLAEESADRQLHFYYGYIENGTIPSRPVSTPINSVIYDSAAGWSYLGYGGYAPPKKYIDPCAGGAGTNQYTPIFSTPRAVDTYEFSIESTSGQPASYINVDLGAARGTNARLYVRVSGNVLSSWGGQVYGSTDNVTYVLLANLTFFSCATPGTSGAHNVEGYRYLRFQESSGDRQLNFYYAYIVYYTQGVIGGSESDYIFGDNYIMKSVNSGVLFSDVTPADYGAIARRGVTVYEQDPQIVTTLFGTNYLYPTNLYQTTNGASGGSSGGSTSASWSNLASSLVATPVSIKMGQSDPNKIFFLQGDKISYSADNGTTLVDKIGNWRSLMAYHTPRAIELAWTGGSVPSVYSEAVSYWAMNEASGSSVADSTGSYNGTATGTTIVTGKLSNARSFNGVSDKVVISSNLGITNGDITIGAWIKATNATGISYDAIVSHYDDTEKIDYRIFHNTTGIAVARHAPGVSWNATPEIAIMAGTWYHVALVYSGTSLSFYLNGAIQSTITATSSGIGSYTTETIIGRGINNGGAFNGLIDEVFIVSRAFSTDEIATVYNGGSGLAYY